MRAFFEIKGTSHQCPVEVFKYFLKDTHPMSVHQMSNCNFSQAKLHPN